MNMFNKVNKNNWTKLFFVIFLMGKGFVTMEANDKSTEQIMKPKKTLQIMSEHSKDTNKNYIKMIKKQKKIIAKQKKTIEQQQSIIKKSKDTTDLFHLLKQINNNQKKIAQLSKEMLDNKETLKNQVVNELIEQLERDNIQQ